MADFTDLRLMANHGVQATPVWVEVGPGAGREVRWSDQNNQHDVASASWPAMIRPAATEIVAHTYAYTADAVGNGFISNEGAANTPAFSIDNYMWARWHWDNLGTFASEPIFTAYLSGAHDTPARDDGSLLGGSDDTEGAANLEYSYLKGNAFGRVVSGGAPAAAPSNAPVVTDGAEGSLAPAAGANWLTNFQSLQGDRDYITAPFTPVATTEDQWNVMFALFTGPNMDPALYTNIMALRYTWT